MAEIMIPGLSEEFSVHSARFGSANGPPESFVVGSFHGVEKKRAGFRARLKFAVCNGMTYHSNLELSHIRLLGL